MAIQNFIQQRWVYILFSLLVLFICASVLFLIDDHHTFSSPLDLQSRLGIFHSPPTIQHPGTPPISNSTAEPAPPSHHQISLAPFEFNWLLCKGPFATDFIPCLDNFKAIKALKTRKHKEHRERHCQNPSPRCLIPLPQGYKVPVRWPKSRDMIWFNNVPHAKLVEYKKDQNWVRKSGDYFVFPGGGTQFKEGVTSYIRLIEKTLPAIQWGKHIRVILDVGCGVASFGGYLLDKNVTTMSVAPKDEHEAQIQFALERGIPATLAVIGTNKLTFPDNSFDVVHCARCRVHWEADGGKPVLEINRILRPGGYFIWSATPVYLHNERDEQVWKAMVALTQSICWMVAAKTDVNENGIGLVIYQKPVSPSCYIKRSENNPPMCDGDVQRNSSWYVPLSSCITQLPRGVSSQWPLPWPKRLHTTPPSLSANQHAQEMYYNDTNHWSALVHDIYMNALFINWSNVRNVMDMNAGYGGFAGALIDVPLWVLNVIPVHAPDTLPIIFDRGLVGIYHDWCESFNTYPRTYDMLHANYLFSSLAQSRRCDVLDVCVEMDRILRPGGCVLVRDTLEVITNLSLIFSSLHWSHSLRHHQFLVANKGFWRPTNYTE